MDVSDADVECEVMQQENAPKLDMSALKVNQAMIILLLLVAFSLGIPMLVLFVGIIMAIGSLLGVPGFKPVYQYCLKPLGLVKPNVVHEHPAGPRFAQGMGAACAIAGAILLLAGNPYAGWGLVWLVIVLAGINLFSGFCAGCSLYYWIKKIKSPLS